MAGGVKSRFDINRDSIHTHTHTQLDPIVLGHPTTLIISIN